MKRSIMVLSLIMLTACGGGKGGGKGSTPPAPAGDGKGNDAKPVDAGDGSNKAGDPANPGAGNQGSTNGASSSERGLYTGFDGASDFSFLIPKAVEVKLDDPSIAKVEMQKIKMQPAAIDKLIASLKAKDAEYFDDEYLAEIRTELQAEISAAKVTPLKAGKTVLTRTRVNSKGATKTKKFNFVVTQYDKADIAAGKDRYDKDGSGKLKACKSCHETGTQGAPPHDLGGVREWSDAQALEWVKTGKVVDDDYQAEIPHAWEFSSKEQEKGIVPYLRSRAARDLESFLTLEYMSE